MTSREKRTLSFMTGCRPDSRLACQARVLIQKGKIITRSRILELQNEDLSIRELRSQTEER